MTPNLRVALHGNVEKAGDRREGQRCDENKRRDGDRMNRPADADNMRPRPSIHRARAAHAKCGIFRGNAGNRESLAAVATRAEAIGSRRRRPIGTTV